MRTRKKISFSMAKKTRFLCVCAAGRDSSNVLSKIDPRFQLLSSFIRFLSDIKEGISGCCSTIVMCDGYFPK